MGVFTLCAACPLPLEQASGPLATSTSKPVVSHLQLTIYSYRSWELEVAMFSTILSTFCCACSTVQPKTGPFTDLQLGVLHMNTIFVTLRSMLHPTRSGNPLGANEGPKGEGHSKLKNLSRSTRILPTCMLSSVAVLVVAPGLQSTCFPSSTLWLNKDPAHPAQLNLLHIHTAFKSKICPPACRAVLQCLWLLQGCGPPACPEAQPQQSSGAHAAEHCAGGTQGPAGPVTQQFTAVQISVLFNSLCWQADMCACRKTAAVALTQLSIAQGGARLSRSCGAAAHAGEYIRFIYTLFWRCRPLCLQDSRGICQALSG
jgi:hypothetical protein